MARLSLVLAQGDLSRWGAEAIGNAANAALVGGGGVDGALHAAAGPSVMAELDALRSRLGIARGAPVIEPGDVVATGAGRLAARHLLHAVGPIWQGGDRGEAEVLARAWRGCLDLAHELGCQSLAMPAVSTGVYGYPVAEAAAVALTTVAAWSRPQPGLRTVTVVLHTEADLAVWRAAQEELEG